MLGACPPESSTVNAGSRSGCDSSGNDWPRILRTMSATRSRWRSRSCPRSGVSGSAVCQPPQSAGAADARDSAAQGLCGIRCMPAPPRESPHRRCRRRRCGAGPSAMATSKSEQPGAIGAAGSRQVHAATVRNDSPLGIRPGTTVTLDRAPSRTHDDHRASLSASTVRRGRKGAK